MRTNINTIVSNVRPLAVMVLGSLYWGGFGIPAMAVSPSISPWETILSVDSTGAAEEDHFVEAMVAGQTIHTVWTASIGYDLHHLCYRRSLDGGSTWQDRVILQDYGYDNWQTLMSGETTRLSVLCRQCQWGRLAALI